MKLVEKSLLKLSALIQAKKQLEIIKNSDASPFNQNCQLGYMRGIDFYREAELAKVVAAASYLFFRKHGFFPNLVCPQGFNEKIVWSKFFRPFQIPESGNKLLTSSFIPESISDQISCPEVVWRSSEANLPGNDEIAPGYYYLKSNHGSNTIHRLSYPIDGKQKRRLQKKCRQWLRKSYGLKNGEWWYNTFPRQLLLERDVVGAKDSISWNFFVFNGEVAHISPFIKGTKQALDYDGDMNRLNFKNVKSGPIPEELITASTLDYVANTLSPLASQIGLGHSFLRIDLFIGQDGSPYLNEITFSPSNGTRRISLEFEQYLGELWAL